MQHRPRRPVSRLTLMVLSPVLRYSLAREAYVLRLIGRHHGPVLVLRQEVRTSPR